MEKKILKKLLHVLHWWFICVEEGKHYGMIEILHFSLRRANAVLIVSAISLLLLTILLSKLSIFFMDGQQYVNTIRTIWVAALISGLSFAE